MQYRKRSRPQDDTLGLAVMAVRFGLERLAVGNSVRKDGCGVTLDDCCWNSVFVALFPITVPVWACFGCPCKKNNGWWCFYCYVEEGSITNVENGANFVQKFRNA